MKSLLSLPLMVLMAALLVGCDQEGPAERAGESIDEAVEDVGNSIEDACEDIKDGVDAEDDDC